MGVTGSISMRGWCGDQPVVLTALVATHATRSLCSAPKLLCARYGFELKPTRSTLYRERGKRVLLQRSGKRYFLVIRVAETSETNSVDVLTSKCEVESLKGEVLFCVQCISQRQKGDYPGLLERKFIARSMITSSATIDVNPETFHDFHICRSRPARCACRSSGEFSALDLSARQRHLKPAHRPLNVAHPGPKPSLAHISFSTMRLDQTHFLYHLFQRLFPPLLRSPGRLRKPRSGNTCYPV